ncbi:MAG: hypothetical protein QM564_09580 [Bergeyella sp.]
MQSIRIYANADGNSQNAILTKTVDLDNGHYFNSLITSGQYVESKYSNSNTRRLKLESVSFKEPVNSQQIMKYKFDYDPTDLPQKFTYAQDYWGGYNGEDDNGDLFPETIFIQPNGSFATYKSRFNTERAVNPPYVTAGILNKITYPTGGYTKYTFEPNTVSDYDYLPSSSIIYPGSYHARNIKNPYKLTVNNLTNKFGIDDSGCTKEPVNDIIIDYSCKIHITKPLQSMPFFSDLEFNCPVGSYTPSGPVWTEMAPIAGELLCNFNKSPVLKDSNGNSVLSEDRWALLNPGEYYVKIRFNGSFEILDNPNYDTYFDVTLNVKEDENLNIRTVGGLRVKRIQNFDSAGQLLSEKEYEYEFTDDGLKLSTGKTILPRFGLYESFVTYPQIHGGQIPYEIFFMSESNLNPFFTNKVQYSKVLEKIKNIKDNQFFTKEYESKNSVILNYMNSAYNAEKILNRYSNSIDISWNNKPISEKFKNSMGSSVLEKGYNYTQLSDYEKVFYTGFRNYIMTLKLGLGYGTLVPHSWNLHHHAISTYSVPTQTTTKEYLSNGEITTTEDYTYSTNNPLLISSQITQSSGETRKTEFLYPQDLVGAESYMINLVQENRISDPVITKAFKKNVQLSEQKIVYSKDAETSQKVLPKFVYFKNGAGAASADTRITYDQYDSKGNLLQYTTKGGVPTAIIWGYNQTQPIAKVVGASYSQVSSLAVAIINASNTDAAASPSSDESSLLSVLDNFRQSLPDYQITTYTYDPLIGVRSITPPSGIREIYIYDTANKLKEVKDINGNVLKEYQYHYKP